MLQVAYAQLFQMDTQKIALNQRPMQLDLPYTTTATMDILLGVVLSIFVKQMAFGVKVYLVAR